MILEIMQGRQAKGLAKNLVPMLRVGMNMELIEIYVYSAAGLLSGFPGFSLPHSLKKCACAPRQDTALPRPPAISCG
ncbi:hypothetical protein [Desulfatibacillum aliphaticivorans]|uniref:hypothetical protein n=1 Tax=Desulfatibacillum aliphaticivorans TaxID=218208 RepID=UPI0004850D88|nr:hypothetical protein [Desulfatibacillum aliphaticivorans]